MKLRLPEIKKNHKNPSFSRAFAAQLHNSKGKLALQKNYTEEITPQ